MVNQECNLVINSINGFEVYIMDRVIKIGLAVMMLICLLPMPYGYYNLVRILAMVGFAILCYASYKEGRMYLAITFGVLAIVFQPFAKVALGREVWRIVDVAVAILLIVSIWRMSWPEAKAKVSECWNKALTKLKKQ